MQLTGPQYREISEALKDAFAYESFERMLQYELSQRLDLIVSKDNGFEHVVFKTVRWAEETGRVDKLIDAASGGGASSPISYLTRQRRRQAISEHWLPA